MGRKIQFVMILLSLLAQIWTICQGTEVLLIYEATEMTLADSLETDVRSGSGDTVKVTKYLMNHDDDDETAAFCNVLEGQDYSVIVDMSWGGWEAVYNLAHMNGVPYVHVEASNKPFVMAIDDFLYKRDAIDAALLFESESELDQSLYHIIGNYNLRVLVVSMEETDPFSRMSNLRPVPSAFVAFGTTSELTTVINEARNRKLIRRDSRY